MNCPLHVAYQSYSLAHDALAFLETFSEEADSGRFPIRWPWTFDPLPATMLARLYPWSISTENEIIRLSAAFPLFSRACVLRSNQFRHIRVCLVEYHNGHFLRSRLSRVANC
jgi:hypothetical protein